MEATLDEVGARAVPAAFDDWVGARGPALLRLAYVLTGNAADAIALRIDDNSRQRDRAAGRRHRQRRRRHGQR